MQRNPLRPLFLLLIAILVMAACGPTLDEDAIAITVVVDGASQVMLVNGEVTIGDVLREAGIALGDLDRVNPPEHSRVSDGMTITVVRAVEETVVVETTIPFESRVTFNDGLPAGETQLLQSGVNGVAEVTYRVIYENGEEVSRSEVRRVLITPPKDEVLMVGSQSELPTVTVSGALAYISGGNAWIIRQNSTNRRPLTIDGGLDGRIFALSADGKRLLFSRAPQQDSESPDTAETEEAPLEEGEAFNTLWVILDTTDPDSEPVRLDLANILYADWVPGTENWFVYSTAEPRPSFPGWQANNDLWRAQILPGGTLDRASQLLESSSGGVYGWYGTFFAFSPDGTTLAWAQPDAIGVLIPVIIETEETPVPEEEATEEIEQEPAIPLADNYMRQTLASFAPRNAYDFIWVPGLAWSPDGTLIATTTHGPPLGGEAPEDSPVFNLTILPAAGGYNIDLGERTGIWSLAQFAPTDAAGESLAGPLAYLEAIEPLDSIASRYRLVLVDRDGSNRRVLLPSENEPGLKPQLFSWSPDGQQIALIVDGNLFLVDVITGFTQQLTGDSLSSSPRWTP